MEHGEEINLWRYQFHPQDFRKSRPRKLKREVRPIGVCNFPIERHPESN
jgi:hypothetical protein